MALKHPLTSTMSVLTASILPLLSTGAVGSTVLEEVIVTSQKREQSLQEVPISIVAMGQNEIESRGIADLRDIRGLVPNLTVSPHTNDPVAMKIFIRGIGQNDTQVTQDPAVALYLDGVYIGTSFGAGFDGVDLERIEVLRGPQGSLYGRNATGGAINLITRRANVDEFEFRQQFDVGNLDAFKSKTFVNVPLGDRAAAKLSYIHSERDGVVENKGLGKDFGTIDRDSVVADLRFMVTDDLVIDYRYEDAKINDTQRYTQVTQQGTGGALGSFVTLTEVSRGRRDKATSFFHIPENEVEIAAHTLQVNWDISDNLTLRSITGKREVDTTANQAFMPTAYVDFGAGPGAINNVDRDTRFEQLSQELQLIGTAKSLEYVVGLFYYEDEARAEGTGISAGRSTYAGLTTTDNKSSAIFSQVTYNPEWHEGRWHFTVGARYAKDKREAFRYNPESISFSADAPDGATYSKSFNNFVPSFTVGYDVSDSINVYGSVINGYKTGGTSMSSPNLALFQAGFDEEEVVSYEIGLKGTFFDGRVRANAALFHMKMDGFQTSIQTGAGPGDRDYLPIDDSKIKGVELDGSVRLSDSFTLNFGYGYLDTELGEDQLVTPAGTFDLIGPMAYAPRNNLSASLNFSKPTGMGDLFANLAYTYHDEVSTSVNVSDNIVLDDYQLVDASFGIENIQFRDIPGVFKVMLWGKNLTDEEYELLGNQSFSFANAQRLVMFGDPRTFGLSLFYNY